MRNHVVILLSLAVFTLTGGTWLVGSKLGAEISALREQVSKLEAEARMPSDTPLRTDSQPLPVVVQTLAEAEALRNQVGTNPSAEQLATILVTIDAWSVGPAEEEQFQNFKLQMMSELRQRIKEEVTALQKAALEAPTGAEATARHTEASRLLALYPMSEEQAAIDEVKLLATAQAEIATRLDVLRRQRYNYWAAKQIETAIDSYYRNSSYISPKKENRRLIASLVQHLAEVDPNLIEPVVLQLYTYAIDLTKGSLAEKDKIDLTKQMSDPSIKRKLIGDF